MKFSNFVSTLAMVCLAFNADALQIPSAMSQYKVVYDLNDPKEVRMKRFAYNLGEDDAWGVCSTIIDIRI